MKKIMILSVLVIFTSISCTLTNNKTKGNGNVTTEQRTVSSFDNIKIDGVLNVYLSQGDTEGVTVEIDDNLQQYVIVSNDGNKLTIESKDKFSNTTKNNVYITLKNLDYLDISGVGNVKTQTAIKSDQIKLDVSGVGNRHLELICQGIEVKKSGVGEVVLWGEASEFIVKKSGVGNLEARELKAGIVSVNSSGVGNVSIYASEELSISNSGVGNVTYRGDAVIKAMDSSGVGKINKVD